MVIHKWYYMLMNGISRLLFITFLLATIMLAACSAQAGPAPGAVATVVAAPVVSPSAAALPTPSPDTALVALPTPSPNPSPLPSMPFRLNAYRIIAADSGKTYSYAVTVRFSVILDQQTYPQGQLTTSCTPQDVLMSISNIPSVPPPFYAVAFQGRTPGTCAIRNGEFHVTIKITPSPD